MPTPEEIALAEAHAAAERDKSEKTEHMIPKSRLDEEIEKRKAAEGRLAAMEAETKAETEKRLVEQSQFKELAEKRGVDLVKAQAEAAKVTAYEKTLTEVLAAQIESLPEDKRALVPDELTTQQRLAWIAKNAAILKAPAAFDIGAGRHGGGEDSKVTLTPEEHAVAKSFGLTDEEYFKNK